MYQSYFLNTCKTKKTLVIVIRLKQGKHLKKKSNFRISDFVGINHNQEHFLWLRFVKTGLVLILIKCIQVLLGYIKLPLLRKYMDFIIHEFINVKNIIATALAFTKMQL